MMMNNDASDTSSSTTCALTATATPAAAAPTAKRRRRRVVRHSPHSLQSRQSAHQSPQSHQSQDDGTGSTASSASSCDPDATVIVFDYDDTLLPTSWLVHVTGVSEPARLAHVDLAPDVQAQLATLERYLVTLLDATAQLGSIVIVTNAADAYVQKTASVFLPRVAEWLEAHQVRVLSARAWYADLFPDDVSAWKRHAFHDVVHAWCGEHGGSPPSHVVSVGDSLYERWAAHDLAAAWGRHLASIKTIKLKEIPTCAELKHQAWVLYRTLAHAVQLEGDLDLSVLLPPPLSPLALSPLASQPPTAISLPAVAGAPLAVSA